MCKCTDNEKNNKKLTKNSLELKKVLGKVVPLFSNAHKETLSKNEAVYLMQKRKRKIRQAIGFGVFCGLVLIFFSIVLILDSIFFVSSSVGRFSDNILSVFRYGLFSDSAPAFAKTIVLLLLGHIAITVTHYIIKLFSLGQNKRRKTVVALIASLVKYIGYLALIILLFEIWGLSPTILAAIIAALGLAIGFGAQNLIGDLLTGFFLIMESSIEVGDIITVDGFRGEVEEVGMRATRFTSATGDTMVANNSHLKKFINMSIHRSVAVCDFTIEYGENIVRVEEVIQAHINSLADKFNAITEGPFYKGLAEFNEKGVVLRIVAKCLETERLQLIRDINREFKLLFDENNIRLAVPKLQLIKK